MDLGKAHSVRDSSQERRWFSSLGESHFIDKQKSKNRIVWRYILLGMLFRPFATRSPGRLVLGSARTTQRPALPLSAMRERTTTSEVQFAKCRPASLYFFVQSSSERSAPVRPRTISVCEGFLVSDFGGRTGLPLDIKIGMRAVSQDPTSA